MEEGGRKAVVRIARGRAESAAESAAISSYRIGDSLGCPGKQANRQSNASVISRLAGFTGLPPDVFHIVALWLAMFDIIARR